MNVLFAIGLLFAAEAAPLTDGEVWNEGVGYYQAGDVTNALRVLRPLMLSKSHGPRAAEVVAKLEYERGNREEAASAAQIALRANPEDAKANRNFTRAVDGLKEIRQTAHINAVLKAAEGQDPSALLKAATDDARRLFTDSGTYRTNAAPKAVSLAEAYEKRAEKLADAWLLVRQTIVQAVTNDEQAATILAQLDQAQRATKKAARELGDLDGEAYATLSQVEHDFTRFLKLTILPPAALDEDLVAQSNAWQAVADFNRRPWQPEALDYTRAFRVKFPMWARAYEQQAQADTNKPPFTAEAQAKVSALATELEKIQLECCEKNLPTEQEKAIGIILEIKNLLPKEGGGGQGDGQGQSQNPSQEKPDQQSQPSQEPQSSEESQAENPEQEAEQQEDEKSGEANEPEEDQEIEAVLKKAQERADEHDAKIKGLSHPPLPPNERDW